MNTNKKRTPSKKEYTTFSIIAFLLILCVFFIIAKIFDINKDFEIVHTILFPFIILISVIVHELIHGLFFLLAIGYRNISKIKFGFSFKLLSPYCHCSKEMNVTSYRIAIIMPFIILGLIPLVIAIFTSLIPIFIYSLIFTSGSVGDLLILYLLRNDKDCFVIDDPKEIGCIILRK